MPIRECGFGGTDGVAAFHPVVMFDLGNVRNYYIAYGYTDFRRGIDSLAAIVVQQYGGHLDKKACSCSMAVAQIELRHYIGWQSTYGSPRVTEGANAMRKAVDFAPEEEKETVAKQAVRALCRICTALASLAKDNFSNSPTEDNRFKFGEFLDLCDKVTDMFCDVSEDVKQFATDEYIECKRQSAEFMNLAGVAALNMVRDKWNELDHPNKASWDTYIDWCSEISMMFDDSIKWGESVDEDYKDIVTRYKNLAIAWEEPINSCSWKQQWVSYASEYRWFEEYSLTDEAKSKRRKLAKEARDMYMLHKCVDKSDAIFFANKTYTYCKEDDRERIKNTFGKANIKFVDWNVPHTGWDIKGDEYYYGKGCEVDYTQALYWYHKAADEGNMYSQNSLGLCYQKGTGVPQCDEQAVSWFEKAYESGSPDGAYNLAECYFEGRGVKKSIDKALEMWGAADKLGHPSAGNKRKEIFAQVQGKRKTHRAKNHICHDIGFQMPIGAYIVAEVTLNKAANAYLVNAQGYQNYLAGNDFQSNGGGYITQSPYNIRIPSSNHWYVIIDNGDDDIAGISATVKVKTL